MNTHQLNKLMNSAVRLACLAASLTIVGCASPSPIVAEKLDPLTGVTVTFAETPLVLYRDNPSRAAYARNFVHLGPIQVNRAGSYRYYLWLGIWNTMQVEDLSGHRDGFESIIVFADGEPLTLELVGWTPEAIGASEPTYLKPVASTADAYYEVTADQIRLIANSRDIRIHVVGTSPKEFQLWDDQMSARNSLAEFLTRN
jgi:hypothetical protein